MNIVIQRMNLLTVSLFSLLISSFANSQTDSTKASNNADSTENIIFERVEVEALFPGGVQAWRSFLERTLNANIPVDNRAPSGSYTVIIQFVVNKNGEISDLKALTNHGYGMEKEVIRVLKKSPYWTPAMQNGKPVRAYRKQPVTFFISNEGPRKKDKI